MGFTFAYVVKYYELINNERHLVFKNMYCSQFFAQGRRNDILIRISSQHNMEIVRTKLKLIDTPAKREKIHYSM
jgi:phosphoheptose isomerase